MPKSFVWVFAFNCKETEHSFEKRRKKKKSTHEMISMSLQAEKSQGAHLWVKAVAWCDLGLFCMSTCTGNVCVCRYVCVCECSRVRWRVCERSNSLWSSLILVGSRGTACDPELCQKKKMKKENCSFVLFRALESLLWCFVRIQMRWSPSQKPSEGDTGIYQT